jgi:hypothetical protein
LNTLSDTEIALAIDQTYDKGAKAIATALVQMVIDRDQPRQDNATVVVSRVLGRGARSTEGDGPSLPLTQVTALTEVSTTPVPGSDEGAAASEPEPAVAAPPVPGPMASPQVDPTTAATVRVEPEAPLARATAATPASRQRPAAEATAEALARRKRRNMLIRIFLTALVSAAIAGVIVTQTR